MFRQWTPPSRPESHPSLLHRRGGLYTRATAVPWWPLVGVSAAAAAITSACRPSPTDNACAGNPLTERFRTIEPTRDQRQLYEGGARRAQVADATDVSKKRAQVIVDTVFSSIVETVHRGEKLELRGLGSFRIRHREPRRGRNPKTGEQVDVPSKRVAYFNPGEKLKALINRQPVQPSRRRCHSSRRCQVRRDLCTGPGCLHQRRERATTLTAKRFIFTIDYSDNALPATLTLSADTAMAEDVEP